MLKIFDAEVMIDRDGFTQPSRDGEGCDLRMRSRMVSDEGKGENLLGMTLGELC